MAVQATRDIEAGEEICFSYIDTRMPLELRRRALRDYGFVCMCPRCEEEEEEEDEDDDFAAVLTEAGHDQTRCGGEQEDMSGDEGDRGASSESDSQGDCSFGAEASSGLAGGAAEAGWGNHQSAEGRDGAASRDGGFALWAALKQTEEQEQGRTQPADSSNSSESDSAPLAACP